MITKMLFGPKKPATPESQYVPNRLGLPRNSTIRNASEFFVYGTRRGDDDSPERILQLFQLHHAKLMSASVFPGNEPSSEFVLQCVLDTAKLDCQVDDLLILIRKQRFVKRAEKIRMSGRTFSNYLFPLLVTNNRRAVILDAESLLAVEDSLKGLDQDQAKAVRTMLFEQGRSQGHRIIEDLKSDAISPDKQVEYMTEAVKGYLRASGWGVFGSNLDRDIYQVNINEPPFVETNGSYFAGGSYLEGLIAGLLESRAEKNVRLAISHESYSKEKKILSLYFAKESIVNSAKSVEMAQAAEEREVKQATQSILEQGELEDDLRDSKPITITGSNHIVVTTDAEPVPPPKSEKDLGDFNVVKRILNTCRTGALRVTVMNAANITLSEANTHIQNLMKADLLEARRVSGSDSFTYQTTSKGLDYLDVHEKLAHMLEEDYPDTRMLREIQSK
jgi:predicted transcriptional regulator